MKHLRVYKNLLENLDDEFSIVIEDDILLENNFDFKLSKLLKQLPNDFDFVIFGSSKLNIHIPRSKIIPFKSMYNKTNYPTTWGGNGMTKTTRMSVSASSLIRRRISLFTGGCTNS